VHVVGEPSGGVGDENRTVRDRDQLARADEGHERLERSRCTYVVEQAVVLGHERSLPSKDDRDRLPPADLRGLAGGKALATPAASQRRHAWNARAPILRA
jgi:hypothetical protein